MHESAHVSWRQNAKSHDWQALSQLGQDGWWLWRCRTCGSLAWLIGVGVTATADVDGTSAAFGDILPAHVRELPDCSMHLVRQIMDR